MTEARRAYLTTKKREQRERARNEKRCIICAKNPADPDHVTCAECRSAVTESRRRGQQPVEA